MKPDNPPAFPRIDGIEQGDYGRQDVIVTGGMSLHDYFAGQAVIGAMVGHVVAAAIGAKSSRLDSFDVARAASEIADEMIAARERAR